MNRPGHIYHLLTCSCMHHHQCHRHQCYSHHYQQRYVGQYAYLIMQQCYGQFQSPRWLLVRQISPQTITLMLLGPTGLNRALKPRRVTKAWPCPVCLVGQSLTSYPCINSTASSPPPPLRHSRLTVSGTGACLWFIFMMFKFRSELNRDCNCTCCISQSLCTRKVVGTAGTWNWLIIFYVLYVTPISLLRRALLYEGVAWVPSFSRRQELGAGQ